MTGPGTKIAGRYQVVRQLGAGSMGSVWLATDTSLNREVAVKSVRGPLVEGDTSSTEGEQRAMREARLIARVNHPNAVAIYDVAVHDRRPWLVMEYLPSHNLTELVREYGPMPPKRAADLGAQVAAAMADAHSAGIVHRDIKPANILIAEHGAAKITDFGIARGDDDVTLTATGQMWGTPAYFAPEMARGDGPSPKSDVWSLGATLYFAVEGAPPYGTEGSALVLLGRIANQEVPPPRQAGPLAPVLQRLLDRDPERRPTMTEAVQMLTDVARGREYGGAPGDGSTMAAAAPPPTRDRPILAGFASERAEDTRPERRRPALLLPLLLLLAVAGVVAAIAWSTLGTDEPGSTAAQQPTQDAPPARSPQPSQQEGSQNGGQAQDRDAQPTPEPPRERPADLFTPAVMEQTVADYYAVMPDDTRTGFSLLGPQLRSQGFDSYDDFWDGIDAVSVSDLQADPAGRTVTGTVVFQSDDGTSTETHRFGLVPDESGERLLIDTDTMIG